MENAVVFVIGSVEKNKTIVAFVAKVKVGPLDATVAALVTSVRPPRKEVAGWTIFAVTVELATAKTSGT